MLQSLVVAVAQPECVPYDVAANALTHAETIRLANARVVVFPELSLTGYELDAPTIAPSDLRLLPLVEACGETGSVALVGAPVIGNTGRAHIAMLAVELSGTTVAYEKLWLSAEESERFAPGKTAAVLDVDGWRLGLAICKDTGVPQHADQVAALTIDAYVAGTLMGAEETPVQEARGIRIATEHHVWVAMASFAGSTGGGYTSCAGRSAIWAPDGAAVARAGSDPGAIARATFAR